MGKFSIHHHKELDYVGNVVRNTLQINHAGEYALWRPKDGTIVEHADTYSPEESSQYRWNSHLVVSLSWGGADNVTEYVPLGSLKWHVCDNNNEAFYRSILDDNWEGSWGVRKRELPVQ